MKNDIEQVVILNCLKKADKLSFNMVLTKINKYNQGIRTDKLSETNK